MKTAITTALILFAVLSGLKAEAPESQNIHAVMMQSTVKIIGKGSTGTGFIIGKKEAGDSNTHYYTLITAHHVLAKAQGEKIILTLRKKDVEIDGLWNRVERPLQIRNGEKQLWSKHPEVDLAAIFVRLPKDTVPIVVPSSLILNDEKLEEYEVGPGSNLMCLGYPLGMESNKYGFPILRSGRIASYPILPTSLTKSFFFDFSIFQGNSGGPVYLYEKSPIYGGKMHLQPVSGLIGVVTEEASLMQKFKEVYEVREKRTPLILAKVIHARFIEDLLDTMGYPNQD